MFGVSVLRSVGFVVASFLEICGTYISGFLIRDDFFWRISLVSRFVVCSLLLLFVGSGFCWGGRGGLLVRGFVG